METVGTFTAKDDAQSGKTGRGMPGVSLPSALHSSAIGSHWLNPAGSQRHAAAHGGQRPCDGEQGGRRVMKGSRANRPVGPPHSGKTCEAERETT